MCGICGWVAAEADARLAPDVLSAMTRALAHRGPDGEGLFEEPGIALGHRRLSILDLAGGSQPFFSPSRRYVITYNGEIYNSPGLRQSLMNHGTPFRTHCDTEVLVCLADRQGFDFVNDLEGIFAFALWDRQERRLLLARDGLGVKPLIYRAEQGALWFASELKALRADKSLSWSVDPQALHDYLGMNSIAAPHTIWREAKRLEPGETLEWCCGTTRKACYWSLPAIAGDPPDEGVLVDRLDHLLDSVHQGQILSDVPVGVFLSAGVDSALVLQRAGASMESMPQAFTLAWPGSSYDESPGAQETAGQLGARLQLCCFEADVRERLPQMAAHFDEPFGDSSAVASWEICRHASKVVKVALSGEGGDEVFGGYQTYRAHALASGLHGKLFAGMAPPMLRLLETLPASDEKSSFRYRARRFLRDVSTTPELRHFLWKSISTEEQTHDLYASEWRQSCAGSLRPPACLWKEAFSRFARLGGTVSTAMMADAAIYLPNDLLTKVDISSMAHGLEVRVPLLDRRLMEFMAPLADKYKADTRHTKKLLRQVCARHGLEMVFRRPKQGFSIPAAKWFRAELRPMFLEAVNSRGFRALGAISPKAVEAILQRHLDRREDTSRVLWGMLMLALWADSTAGV